MSCRWPFAINIYAAFKEAVTAIIKPYFATGAASEVSKEDSGTGLICIFISIEGTRCLLKRAVKSLNLCMRQHFERTPQ